MSTTDEGFDTRMGLAKAAVSRRERKPEGLLSKLRRCLRPTRHELHGEGYVDAVEEARMLLHSGLEEDLAAAQQAFEAHAISAHATADTAVVRRETFYHAGRADGWKRAARMLDSH